MALLTLSPMVASISGSMAGCTVRSSPLRTVLCPRYSTPFINSVKQQAWRTKLVQYRAWFKLLSIYHRIPTAINTSRYPFSPWAWFVQKNSTVPLTSCFTHFAPPNPDIPAPSSITLTSIGGWTIRVAWEGLCANALHRVIGYNRQGTAANWQNGFWHRTPTYPLASSGSFTFGVSSVPRRYKVFLSFLRWSDKATGSSITSPDLWVYS